MKVGDLIDLLMTYSNDDEIEIERDEVHPHFI